jgi:hypothetical protein
VEADIIRSMAGFDLRYWVPCRDRLCKGGPVAVKKMGGGRRRWGDVNGPPTARLPRRQGAPGQGASGLGRVAVVGLRRLGAFIHELVEFRLVLGVTQTLEEGLEGVLFLFQAAQRVGLVGVERGVA